MLCNLNADRRRGNEPSRETPKQASRNLIQTAPPGPFNAVSTSPNGWRCSLLQPHPSLTWSFGAARPFTPHKQAPSDRTNPRPRRCPSCRLRPRLWPTRSPLRRPSTANRSPPWKAARKISVPSRMVYTRRVARSRATPREPVQLEIMEAEAIATRNARPSSGSQFGFETRLVGGIKGCGRKAHGLWDAVRSTQPKSIHKKLRLETETGENLDGARLFTTGVR